MDVQESHLQQIRDQQIFKKYNEDIHLKEAQDKLNDLQTKDHEERMRIQYNKKLLNDDFVQSNRAIVDMVQKSKELQETLKKKDTYNYFPFVAGELIEKHRNDLGV